jgi:protein arginine kinase
LNDSGNNPEDLELGEWLRGTGPSPDIAVCTRVRLARNVQGYSFSSCLGELEAQELTTFLSEELSNLPTDDALTVTDLLNLRDLDREMLMERHLISRDHASNKHPRSVAVNAGESISVMINEEDHIRAQVFQSGFQVEEGFEVAERLDNTLMERLPLAFSEEFGFLTTCPTNTGTGLRVSVMLHLPGLVWAEEMEKATSTAQKIHLAVRGLYGEGSRALGDFYQVSNQVTLGRSETQILQDVSAAVTRIVEWEREVREALMKGRARLRTLDKLHRAMGTLERAHILNSEESLTCLSAVRFGVQQGLFGSLTIQQLNRALLLSQPAHLQRLSNEVLGPDERDERRAMLVRELLGNRLN